MTILEEIAEYTKARIEKEKKQISTNELRTLAEKMNENEGFVFEDAIRNSDNMAFICECKKASPSKGIIANEFPYVDIALEYEAAGADAVSLINTLTGMKIDVKKRQFALANKTGGLSGPAVHPIAVRMVYQVAQAVKIPIIGMGGVMNAEDAIELILAGATAVSVGTANFTNPRVTEEIVEGIREYMSEQGVDDINDLIGAVK